MTEETKNCLSCKYLKPMRMENFGYCLNRLIIIDKKGSCPRYIKNIPPKEIDEKQPNLEEK